MLTHDPLVDQARRLVTVANTLAVSAFISAIDHYAFLKKCDPQEWDFFATTASVQVGIANLMRSVSTERFKMLYASITSELHKWNPKGEAAVLDCQSFVKRTLDAQPAGADNVLPIDALGMWIVWNVIRRTPTDEEAQASRSIGGMLAAPFHDWWDSK